MHQTGQRVLNPDQIKLFYHDEFVHDQVADFISLTAKLPMDEIRACDLGGGCGFFADSLSRSASVQISVLDLDEASVQKCTELGVSAEICDILNPPAGIRYDVACFNMILHHLVSSNESRTSSLQRSALMTWQERSDYIFINEYIYDSYFNDFSGWLIFKITSSYIFSAIGRLFSYIFPSLFANTFNVGVRFRSNNSWNRIFSDSGFRVVGYSRGRDEYIPLPRRLLFIKSWRRDSYLICSSKK
jgi:hypothetical protein